MSERRSAVFSLVVLLTLGIYGLVGVVLLRPDLIGRLLGHEIAGHISAHFRLPHHRVHDITFGIIVGTAALGLLAQLRTPAKHVAAQLMALIPWVALVLAFVLANTPLRFAPAPILGALTLFAALLHPARRDFLRSFRMSRMNRVMLTMVIVAAAPLLAYAWSNIGLQRTLTNDHAALGHYGFMAAFSFTLIGVSLVASLRPDGWRFTVWVAGSLAAASGLVSVVFPDLDSSLGLLWALALIAWGATFVAAAELTSQTNEHFAPERAGDGVSSPESSTGSGSVRASTRNGRPNTSTPRWAYVIGIIALILVLGLLVLHLTGGGFRHATP